MGVHFKRVEIGAPPLKVRRSHQHPPVHNCGFHALEQGVDFGVLLTSLIETHRCIVDGWVPVSYTHLTLPTIYSV